MEQLVCYKYVYYPVDILYKKFLGQTQHIEFVSRYLNLRKVRETVYSSPGSKKMKTKPAKFGKEMLKKENVNKNLYPEYYRKFDYVKGKNLNTLDPFIVARIPKFEAEGMEEWR